jgi:transglutaminase-like putative cysteine protease
MSFAQLHKWIAYLISGLGLCALSLGSELSDGVLAAIAIGFLTSWFAEGPLLLRPRYAQGWTAAVVAALLFQVARGVSDTPTLAMAIEFAAFLQISRLWNRRSAIDYQQIAVLAFLHLIAATVLSTNLSYAALFIGFVIATPWMLALSHLRREIEGNYPSGSSVDPAQRNAIERVLSSRRVVGPGFLVGTALLSLPLFAMTLAIFVTIPRVGQGFLSLRRESGQKVAGFGNQVELGGFGVIRDDPTVVVRVLPQPRIDEKAARVSLRMRGTSFDRYDGKRWTRRHSEPQPLRSGMQGMRVLRRVPDPARDRRMQIVLDHLEEPVVFLPEGTVSISVPPRVSAGQNVRRELTHAPGLDLRYDAIDGLGLVYTAWVSRDPAEADIVPIAPERRSTYLAVPPGHERLAQLAQRVVGSASTAAEKAVRLQAFLKQGAYNYSLNQPDVGKDWPLIAFLFKSKSGHCEYFSSAMAIMLRSVGVPARNVTGFVGGRFNPYGGYYALRQGDAHSWVEAYHEGRGWVTYDPTPAARGVVGPSDGLWADVNALVDALRTRWTTSVVGYDLRTQVGMLRKLAAWVAAHRSRGGERDSADGDGSFKLSPAFKTSARVLGVLLVAGALAWFLRRRLRPGQKRKDPPAARAVSLYGELERALRKRGHPRPPAVTPLEHARALERQGFAQHADVQVVTSRYVEARFGGRPLARTEISELRQAIDRVRRAA